MAWHQTDQLQRTACRDGNERCGDNPKAVGQQFSENTRAAVVGSMEYHGDEVRLGMHAKVGGQAPSQARNLLRQLGRAIDERFGASLWAAGPAIDSMARCSPAMSPSTDGRKDRP
jgi:hypothetical protein